MRARDRFVRGTRHTRPQGERKSETSKKKWKKIERRGNKGDVPGGLPCVFGHSHLRSLVRAQISPEHAHAINALARLRNTHFQGRTCRFRHYHGLVGTSHSFIFSLSGWFVSACAVVFLLLLMPPQKSETARCGASAIQNVPECQNQTSAASSLCQCDFCWRVNRK